MSNERLYLQKMREALRQFADQAHDMEAEREDRSHDILLLLDEACSFEKTCRTKYEMGVRFNVIANQLRVLRDRFHADHQEKLTVQKNIAENLALVEKPEAGDETLVFVYLFNFNGAKARNWEALLTNAALSEHSVNRPIYPSLECAKDFIHARPNPVTHAIVEVIVPNELVIENLENSTKKDSLGHPMLRLKQSALKQTNIKAFYHMNKVYRIAANGGLVLDQASEA